MRKTALTAAAVLSLALPAGASAITMAHGKAIIRANARRDHPARITLTHCRRSPHAVRCWVTEYGAHSSIEGDDGQRLVGTLSYEGEAR